MTRQIKSLICKAEAYGVHTRLLTNRIADLARKKTTASIEAEYCDWEGVFITYWRGSDKCYIPVERFFTAADHAKPLKLAYADLHWLVSHKKEDAR